MNDHHLGINSNKFKAKRLLMMLIKDTETGRQ